MEANLLATNKRIDILQMELRSEMQQDRVELFKKTDLAFKQTMDNNLIVSEFSVKFNQLKNHFAAEQESFYKHKEFMLNTMPTLTYLQISDTLQEFLCLGDQLKLIDVDRKKMMALRNTTVTVDALLEYVSDIQNQVL